MRLLHIGPSLPPLAPSLRSARPDWQQADPARIQRALQRALARPTGGWYALDASRRLKSAPLRFEVNGLELVAFRDREGAPVVAPAACPHMGADLACGSVKEGRVVCPWHGLALGPEGHGSWRPLPSYDDGVLLWVRLGEGTRVPLLPPRPARFVDGVIRIEGRCEPADVIANRLDPWHGAHFHPHSFARLRVTHEDDERLVVRVSFRIAGPLCSEVDASFHCPDARTIVMTILAGEGAGSVVETHATPLGPGRTAIVEATLATSERLLFPVLRQAQRFVRPFVEARARRLWVEDTAYAERMFALRQGEAGSTERTSSVDVRRLTPGSGASQALRRDGARRDRMNR
jgi:hypothetical protein